MSDQSLTLSGLWHRQDEEAFMRMMEEAIAVGAG